MALVEHDRRAADAVALRGVRGWFARRRAEAVEFEIAERLRWSWRACCEGAGLSHTVDTASGATVSTPRITALTLGDPTTLVVRLLPGQVIGDVRALAGRLAPHLGAVGLRVEPRGLEHVRIELLTVDPLADVLPLDATGPGVLLGRDESGEELRVDPVDLPHMIVQGTTRSGKSVFTYGLLAQLVRRSDVLITGVDPTGLLFRPFAGSHHADWQTSGLGDLDAVEKLLTRVVAEMDSRIRTLPMDRDTAALSDDQPAVFVVLEEWAGCLKVLDAVATRDDKPGTRVRALVSRLLAEGAKVGVKVLILVQRAEATVVGALERSQCSLRISFRVDSMTSVELLHAGADRAVADAHTIAAPGIALVTRPGAPLARLRAPFLGSYAAYAAAVTGERA